MHAIPGLQSHLLRGKHGAPGSSTACLTPSRHKVAAFRLCRSAVICDHPAASRDKLNGLLLPLSNGCARKKHVARTHGERAKIIRYAAKVSRPRCRGQGVEGCAQLQRTLISGKAGEHRASNQVPSAFVQSRQSNYPTAVSAQSAR